MLEKNNGYFEQDGKEYILTQQAYLSGTWDHPYYEAMAICTADKTDEDGYQPAYKIKWNLLKNYDQETTEADMACNWDEPDSVEKCCEYNATLDQFF